MRERVSAILGRPAEGLWLGTFHALCARMLRRHAEHGRADVQFHHPGHRRPAAAAEAGDGGRADRHQALGAAGADGADPALEGPRPDAGAASPPAEDTDFANGRAAALYAGLPGSAARAERRRFRRPAAAHDGDPARPAGRAGAIPPRVPLHPGGRVPGHQPRPVPVAAAAGAGAPEHLLRRRRRPVDLFLARRRGGKHPALREGFSGRARSCGWSATTAPPRRSWPPPPA